MLKCPEESELLEAEETGDLSTGEATQAPDVKPIRQCSPIIIPQSINISEHADNGCGNGRLVIPKEAAEDEVGSPLAISQLRRRLLYLPHQEIPQITDLQIEKLLTHNDGWISNAQNLQGLEIGHRIARRNPTPKANAQNGTPVDKEHPHLAGAKMDSPRVMEEPLHPAPHQGVPHMNLADAKEGTKAQLR
jgi:hypothetical protein